MDEVRLAADVPVGIAGDRGEFPTFSLEADIPALLFTGALESLGGHLDFLRKILCLGKVGIQVPLKVTRMGRYPLSAASLPGEGSAQFASRFSWDTKVKRPKLPNGGLHVANTADVLYQLGPPTSSTVSKAVALGGALDPGVSDPEKIAMEFDANWGRASACQLNRAPADAGDDNQGFPVSAGEMLRQREVFRASDKAPYLRAAGTSSVLSRNEKFQADLLFVGGAIALRGINVYSKCPLLFLARPKIPPKVWDAFSGSRIAVFRGPRTLRIFARSET